MVRTCSAAWTAAACAMAIGILGQLSATAADMAQAKSTAPVSMTGCLRADGASYRLTGLKGDKAPKGRSWKTAFVVKTNKNLVVRPSTGVNLRNQIGRQVTVTGVIDGTNMTARSIKRVATSCS